MSFTNSLSRIVAKLDKFPKFMRSWVLTKAIGNKVKMIGACKVDIEYMRFEESRLRLKNRTRVQNHIGGIHACGATLLAESATGLVVGMNVPDSSVPVIKSINVKFVKRMQGNLLAVASLSEQQMQQVRTTEKGEMTIPIKITDDSGQEPVICDMVWAWVPKKQN
ncbi:MAG: DUF4442 domain-containing protein [Aestuariibacter sp.]